MTNQNKVKPFFACFEDYYDLPYHIMQVLEESVSHSARLNPPVVFQLLKELDSFDTKEMENSFGIKIKGSTAMKIRNSLNKTVQRLDYVFNTKGAFHEE